MAILTLISDIGYNNHDLSRFRLRVRQQLPGAELEIINAAVARHDIAEAAYVLDCVLPDFPPDTVHLVDIRADLNAFGPGLVARVKDQWVIAANNGLLSLLSFKAEKVGTPDLSLSEAGGIFSLLNTFLPMAKMVLDSGGNIKLAAVENLQEKFRILPVMTGSSIRGTVIYVDSFGNAVTNITRDILEKSSNGRKMMIRLNRHDWIGSVSRFYSEAAEGEAVCLWTSGGHLQVSVHHGDASRLLGLSKGKMITIDFE